MGDWNGLITPVERGHPPVAERRRIDVMANSGPFDLDDGVADDGPEEHRSPL